jgi:hypothetical protein
MSESVQVGIVRGLEKGEVLIDSRGQRQFSGLEDREWGL